VAHPRPALRDALRRRAGALLVDSFFRASAYGGAMLPFASARWHGLEVEKDVPYGAHPAQRLDIYRPRGAAGPLPAVLYIHGGGFRILSKESHWLFSLMFARRGHVVFNIGYRLAPEHPYPAAIEDACAAYAWLARHGPKHGADLSRLVISGESAGANLATGVALAASYRRPEPFARSVFDLNVRPRAVVPACGVLQVSDPDRYLRQGPRPLSRFMHDRLAEIADSYLQGVVVEDERDLDFADPLVFLERGQRPDRPLPPFFAPCGAQDPLLADSRRLASALEKLGVACDAPVYDWGHHGFHAFLFLPSARRCWGDLYRFLDRSVA
jgi:acetyl esterase